MYEFSKCSFCRFYEIKEIRKQVDKIRSESLENKDFSKIIQRCHAFPEGIPSDIYNGKTDHNRILDGQVGSYIYTENVKRQKAPSAKSKKKDIVVK